MFGAFITWFMNRLHAISAWLKQKFPPLNSTFDKTMALIAGVVLIVTVVVIVSFNHLCAPSIAILNILGLAFLLVSIPVSLIGAKNNWQWPVVLALVGIALWCMSASVGPTGVSEIPQFFERLVSSRCTP